MEPRLQRRVQRYGWDKAAADYERLWQAQLGPARSTLLERVAPALGERVLDVACGTGLVSFAAAASVGAGGSVLGVDISGAMVDASRRLAVERGVVNATFARMDAEALELPDAAFDVALCALGLMYLPDPEHAVRELRRVVRPAGRVGLAVWGDRRRCGWSPVFAIVDAEVQSEVCPLFFRLGQDGALARACVEAGLGRVEEHRLATVLRYADAEDAADAALVGGPVALAWSRFDAGTRQRVRSLYLEAIAAWRVGEGYEVPGEFVVVIAARA